MNRIKRRKAKIRKITARKPFEVEDTKTGLKVQIDIGDVGELLGGKREGKGYTVIIKERTLYVKEKKTLKYLFDI